MTANQTTSLGHAYSEKIRPFIDVIDNLRRIGLEQDIDLPKVVVVGDQSSGKSSIIEAISGIELPRGKGIVTRCPLELQLKKSFDKPWHATLTYKDKSFQCQKRGTEDPSQVEPLIREAQEEMCSSSKGVSKELITLRVESPAESAPDLTLIDLPGIARIAVEGQPSNICEQIKDIIEEYVKNENTVILCVVSANLDAAVNESIKIAKSADNGGARTLGVITKPDIADESQKEDVLCLLNNEKIALAKGYHMVKCRSQRELEAKMTLEESLEKETDFFMNDKIYRTANEWNLGTMNLAKKITEELVHVIKATLPSMTHTISNLLRSSRDDLRLLPNAVPENKQEKLLFLMKLVTEMNIDIKTSLYKGHSNFRNKNHFFDWRKRFTNFKQNVEKLFNDALKNEFTVEKLETEISEKRGAEISGFLNYELFERLVSCHVMRYKDEASKLLESMSKSTEETLRNVVENHFRHLVNVAGDLKQIVNKQVIEATKRAEERIAILFNEEDMIFTMDAAFTKELELLRKEEDDDWVRKNNLPIAQKPPNDMKEQDNAKKMLKMIKCYINIVHSRLSDVVPMTLRYSLHIELYHQLSERFLKYSAECNIEDIISENKDVSVKRQRLNDKINRLLRGLDELSKL